ncbi:hypothetical protein [Faecalibacterium prausnitzii]|uniref:hypothetical protein n=1 Tax=Faecalibacterium prausnitzii TaxID=853 RepID=UPI0012DF3FED|nr:hypothetical protein [Faecalibacterium prausnitzii]
MIISIFTALAAIASCIISAFDLYSTNQLTKYTVQATHDLESEKLFFNAKAEAYHTFLHSASNFMANPSAENSLKLNTDCTYAVLFSSQKTQNAISAYGKSLVRYQSDPKSEALTAEMVHAQVTAMHAMQEELSTTMRSKVPQ